MVRWLKSGEEAELEGLLFVVPEEGDAERIMEKLKALNDTLAADFRFTLQLEGADEGGTLPVYFMLSEKYELKKNDTGDGASLQDLLQMVPLGTSLAPVRGAGVMNENFIRQYAEHMFYVVNKKRESLMGETPHSQSSQEDKSGLQTSDASGQAPPARP